MSRWVMSHDHDTCRPTCAGGGHELGTKLTLYLSFSLYCRVMLDDSLCFMPNYNLIVYSFLVHVSTTLSYKIQIALYFTSPTAQATTPDAPASQTTP